MQDGQPQYWNKEPAKNSIPQPFKGHLEELNKHCERPKQFKVILFDLFDSQEDPLHFVLDLVHYTTIFSKKPKPKHGSWLLVKILKLLVEWCEGRDVSSLLTKKLKSRALDVAMECYNGSNERHLYRIFQLETEKENAKNITYQLLSDRNFKQAYYVISCFSMEKEFDIKHCLFPLFFMEMETFTKQYLTKVPQYQIPFVTTLDDICQDSSRLREFVKSVNADGLYPNKIVILEKYALKRLSTYVELFNIDIKHCPNMHYMRISKGMHYLFYKKFNEESVEYIPWEELTVELISNFPDLQRELLVRLVTVNEAPAAVRLAGIFKIAPCDWPDALKCVPDYILKSCPKGLEKKSSNVLDNFLRLRLSRSDVYFVDTPKKLFDAVDDISDNYDIVGMDVEWKPDLGLNFNKGLSKVALLQLAVWDAVYLIDVMVLRRHNDSSLWDHMLKRIFYNKDIMKLGYGGKDDLRFLMATIGVGQKDSPILRYVDLHTFYTKLQTHHPEVCQEVSGWHPPTPADLPDQKGLSQMCRNILGRNLNKGEQFSNWEGRPLRESQVIYAALDAYCLLMVYEKMYSLLKEKGLDLEKVLITKALQKTEKEIKPQKTERDPIRISDLRVVVDNNVRGVIRYLRVLGADVACIGERQDNMEAVKIAQNEHRIVLTATRQYKKILGYLPEDMCFCIDASVPPRCQVLQILEHFKVICEDSSLLSRCTERQGKLILLDEPTEDCVTANTFGKPNPENTSPKTLSSPPKTKNLKNTPSKVITSNIELVSNVEVASNREVSSSTCDEPLHSVEEPFPKVRRNDMFQFEEAMSSEDDLDDLC